MTAKIVEWVFYVIAGGCLLGMAYFRGYVSGLRWSRGLWTNEHVDIWEWPGDFIPMSIGALSIALLLYGTFPS